MDGEAEREKVKDIGESELRMELTEKKSVRQRLGLIERHTYRHKERERRDAVNTYFPSESEKSSERRHRAAICLFLQPKHHPSN